MRSCAVLNCTNNSDKPSPVSNRISYHLFPKDPETRQAWIYATGRLNWTPRQYSTICSEHFTEYDFTIKNGKKFLRSTTVPRFNLNEQNTRYSEAQYHNETQAALQFLTGQIFPETQIPVEQEAEVVTVQVIGGNNPNVVVKKPTQNKSNPPEKKPRYFSIVNVFKSEAELKAEQDKIHELIRDNLDPSISKILLSINQQPVKRKKKQIDENSSKTGSVNMPRPKNGQCAKLAKNKPLQDPSGTSERHYTDNLTREEMIHRLKQKDMKLTKQQMTIRQLQKAHLRDKVLIESLQIKLKLKNDQTVEETTNVRSEYLPQNTRIDFTFMQEAPQILTKKRMKTTDLENHYQSNGSFSDQNQVCFDTQNRRSDVGFKKPTKKTYKRQRTETMKSKYHQSKKTFTEEDQICFDTQNKHSVVRLKKPAQQQRMEATNVENHLQSSRNISDRSRPNFDTQNRHSEVRLKTPARLNNIVIHKQEIIKTANAENFHQSSMIFSDQNKTHFYDY